jgi:hypothetical protein
MSIGDVQVHLNHPKTAKPEQAKGLVRQGRRLRYRRAPKQEEGMTKKMTIAMMMTSMIQRMAKKS